MAPQRKCFFLDRGLHSKVRLKHLQELSSAERNRAAVAKGAQVRDAVVHQLFSWIFLSACADKVWRCKLQLPRKPRIEFHFGSCGNGSEADADLAGFIVPDELTLSFQ
jgi:hypothetical protein